jgi:hypothetical protein
MYDSYVTIDNDCDSITKKYSKAILPAFSSIQNKKQKQKPNQFYQCVQSNFNHNSHIKIIIKHND